MNGKILVIGDSCEDIFIRGDVKRLCPEGPVAVLNPIYRSINGGMSANVFENILSLKDDGVRAELITNKTSITKIRYVDDKSGYLLLRVDEDNKIDRINIADVVSRITSESNELLAVVVSDYNKGFIEEDDLNGLAVTCNFLGIPLFLDTKKTSLNLTSRVYCTKINDLELSKLTVPYTNFAHNLIVTKGKDGAELYSGGTKEKFPSEVVEVRDVSGCGDSFLAGLVVKYCETNSLQESIKYANKVAAIAASKRGVVAVSKTEIK